MTQKRSRPPIQITMSPETAHDLRVHCAAYGFVVSHFVEAAVQAALDRERGIVRPQYILRKTPPETEK